MLESRENHIFTYYVQKSAGHSHFIYCSNCAHEWRMPTAIKIKVVTSMTCKDKYMFLKIQAYVGITKFLFFKFFHDLNTSSSMCWEAKPNKTNKKHCSIIKYMSFIFILMSQIFIYYKSLENCQSKMIVFVYKSKMPLNK